MLFRSLDLADVTTLTKNSKVFVVGPSEGKAQMSGFYDPASNAFNDIVAALKAKTAEWPFMVAAAGYGSIGNRAYIGQGWLEGYEIAGSVGDAVTAKVDVHASDAAELGVILADLSARTANGNGTGVDDQGAASSNGGIATLHVTAFSGFTSVTVKVQHSTDNSTFADLVTFTAVTGATEQLSTVAEATTVNRYLRALWTVTGSGSITFAVGFARR